MDTRIVEEKMAKLFSTCRPFSEHLKKWEDDSLPDKYDHNCFEYSGQPTLEEFSEAVSYQKGKGASFIKLEGDEPLSETFGLGTGVSLTLQLAGSHAPWSTNERLAFGEPTLEELEEIEVKHFGKLYGEDFARRNIRRSYDKLTYHGAYLNGDLVGAAYSYTDPEHGLTCIDGLIVDEDHRGQYVATSLIAYVEDRYPDTRLFIHADDEDTPKEMYIKMGFETVDRLYEYLCVDIGSLKEHKK